MATVKTVTGGSILKPIEVVGSYFPAVFVRVTLASGESGSPYIMQFPQFARIWGHIITVLDSSDNVQGTTGDVDILIGSTAGGAIPIITLDSGGNHTMAEGNIYHILVFGESRA